jgi:hypothetical protein
MHKMAVAAFGAALILAGVSVAQATDLHGDAFISAMQGNTLSGKSMDGTPFKMFFVPGGQATVQRGSGQPEMGSWHLDDAGDVCLKFPDAVGENGCFKVKADGHKVTWSNKKGTGHGKLLGGVADLEMSQGQ